MERNEIVDRDAYKSGHWKQLIKAYQWFSSYLEARKGSKHPYIIAILISYIIRKHYERIPTLEDLDEAVEISTRANGYNTVNTEVWERVIKLGHYPMKIMGLPEGTRAPIGTPLIRLEPTEDWFASTCNGEETKLMRLWYPCTLATRLDILKKELEPIFNKADCLDDLDFAVNGFEARSATSAETSDIAGMTSLFFNRGTDNQSGQRLLNKFYKGGEDRMKTVWATEHACALSYGPGEGEYEYVKAQLQNDTNFIKSIVGDTYCIKNFVDNVLTRKDVKDLIIAHIGRIVVRHDSGNMYQNIIYSLKSLTKNFGFETTKGGIYTDHVGVMQADGVKPHTTVKLFEDIVEEGFSPRCCVVGGGTGLMFDELSRDYNRIAMKPSINIINGEEINVSKQAPGKKSKGGYLKVDKHLVTHSSIDYTVEEFAKIEDIMIPYYDNGEILINDFQTIFNTLNNG